MTGGESIAVLVAAGIGAGLCGSVAGLASVVSFPALLAYGLPPAAANVTNTVAMVASALGSASASRTELRTQRGRILILVSQSSIGGLAGAVLLLCTPATVFDVIVPWLVAFGAGTMLARDPLRRWITSRRGGDGAIGPKVSAWLIVVSAAYGGYFGAGVGIILLSVLSLQRPAPLPVVNAMKNVATGAANTVSAVTFALFGSVDWTAAGALGLGAFVGSSLGPLIVRRAPQRTLRYLIAVAGLGLAAYLAR